MHHAGELLPGSGSPRLDMELLICMVLGCDRSALYANPDQAIPDKQVSRFQDMIEKRNTGWPVAYLLGVKEFWSLPMRVNQYTLIPRPETECLVETALEFIPLSTTPVVADLGTGCGAIAIAIASERPACRIIATDRCEDALRIAEDNARSLGICNIVFLHGDWFHCIRERLDIIVCNPPYIPAQDPHLQSGDIRHEPAIALDGGDSGLDNLTQVITTAQEYLKPEGRLFVEHGYDQSNAVQEIFTQSGFREVITVTDYAGVPRLTHGRISKQKRLPV